MNLRMLGTTGLLVSPIGLGLAALGRPGYITLGHTEDLQGTYDETAMQAHSHAVLDSAWRAGVRYFDAARSYGRAEAFLGSWLAARQISPESVTIGSKWGYTYTAGWQVEAERHEVKEHTRANLQRQWQESREFLGDYVKLYQVHSATDESGVLQNQEVLAELAHLRAGGIRLGLSLSGPRQADVLEQAMAVTLDGARLFDVVQATWNLLERSAGPALSAAHAAGMGVIVKEALANGRLTERNDAPAFAPQRALLVQEAAERNTSVDALALSAVLSQPWADVVLSGAATREQMESNLGALEVSWDAEAWARLTALAEPAERYWATRQHLRWN